MNLLTRVRRRRLPPARLLIGLAVHIFGVAQAQPTHVQLPAPAQGKSAIAALGDKLPEVARAYGLEAQELETLFQSQSSLGVDMKGWLMFACAGLALSEEELRETEAAAGSTTVTSSETLGATTTEPFKLHSLPGAPRVIYLDFNGHVTTGTAWNTDAGGSPTMVSQPFSLDGDASTFNSSELSFISNVWKRVAEDFAPFSVDVTTEDPGVESLRRTDSSDKYYGIRVVISPTNFFGGGGIAYIGSFNWNSDTPVFVFSGSLGNSEKSIAECSSHEVGHSLGLYHDGVGGSTPSEYYRGHGNWAPIMGTAYSKVVSQFSRGEYANANNSQDDLAIITTYVPLVADDHGNSLSTATILAGPNVNDGGTIETRIDVDMFRLDSAAGAISFNIQGPGPDVNVDLKAELLNAVGDVIQNSDSSTLGATINATVPAGTYYLRIDGVGLGDPVTTGYSDYGSIGNYVITGSFPTAGTKQAPVAVLSASAISGTAPLTVDFSGQNSSDADGTIASYGWTFASGAGAAGMNSSYTYTTAGIYVAALTVVDNDGLSGTASVTISVSAPANIPPTAVAVASTTSGTAPVPVLFSATGSADSDGTITSYKWDFGDGTSATAASASKTYTSPGKYTAKLTVTDDRGASASSSVDVTVLGNPDTDADVFSFALSSVKEKSGTTAFATIKVLDRMGRPVVGATVAVQWSGIVSGNSSGKTDANGQVILAAQRSKKTGLETAKITAVTPLAGTVFDGSIYAEVMAKSIDVR